MVRFLLICLGGAVGTAARYGVQVWARAALGPAFPWGTLAVNLIGSFLIAVIMTVGLEAEAMSVTTRMTLVTGVMGGFTTYSSFNNETVTYLEAGLPARAALNVAVTVAVCLAAGFAGVRLGAWLSAPG